MSIRWNFVIFKFFSSWIFFGINGAAFSADESVTLDRHANTFSRANQYIASEQYELAEHALSKLLHELPSSPEVVYNLAIVSVKMGRLDMARTLARQAMTMTPVYASVSRLSTALEVVETVASAQFFNPIAELARPVNGGTRTQDLIHQQLDGMQSSSTVIVNDGMLGIHIKLSGTLSNLTGKPF